jgi:hypothetical protein
VGKGKRKRGFTCYEHKPPLVVKLKDGDERQPLEAWHAHRAEAHRPDMGRSEILDLAKYAKEG